MVDDQVYRHLGVDFLGVAAQAGHGGAQGGQVDNGRYAGEVLQDDPAGHKSDLWLVSGVGLPVGQLGHIFGLHQVAIAVTQQALQQDFNGEGQPVYLGQAVFLQFLQAIVVDVAPAG